MRARKGIDTALTSLLLLVSMISLIAAFALHNYNQINYMNTASEMLSIRDGTIQFLIELESIINYPGEICTTINVAFPQNMRVYLLNISEIELHSSSPMVLNGAGLILLYSDMIDNKTVNETLYTFKEYNESGILGPYKVYIQVPDGEKIFLGIGYLLNITINNTYTVNRADLYFVNSTMYIDSDRLELLRSGYYVNYLYKDINICKIHETGMDYILFPR